MKNVILVPKDKSPLKVLEDMGEQTRNAWIYFNRNAVDNMHKDLNRISYHPGSTLFFIWNTAKEDVILKLDVKSLEDDKNPEWIEALKIESSKIAFKCKPADPDEILFLKMEE